MPHYDIVIVGSGIVGATAALALAKKNPKLQIALVDAQNLNPTWQASLQYDARVSAISLASKRIFQKLSVWEKILSKRISPYTQMHVWDAQGKGEVHFDCKDVHEPALGYIIEDNVTRTSLWDCFSSYPNLHFLYPVKLMALQEKATHIELVAEDLTIFSAKLIIAADGATSWVREQAEIALSTADYQHTAIVTTVQTALPHQATAWQRFLPTGPLAFLPLPDAHTSSIVWSTGHAQAAELIAQDDETFRKNLSAAFAQRLGDVVTASPRKHFPLHMRHAKNYIKSRLALIGDAAHTIHPLAGQGVNMGLLDAACLVEVISSACASGRDFASVPTLRRYERWRRGDNLTLLASVDTIKKLFMSEHKSLLSLRNFGLNFTNRSVLFKQFFANYALGKRSDLPEMAI